jgi:hypothetical protein
MNKYLKFWIQLPQDKISFRSIEVEASPPSICITIDYYGHFGQNFLSNSGLEA